MSIAVLIPAGIVAGLLTTVAGLGGGILLIALLSMIWAPATVLGVTTPALFIGNLSRLLFLRQAIHWRTVAVFSLTSVPAAFGGSLLASALPTHWLRVAIALFLVAFIAQELRAKAAVEARPNVALPLAGGAIAGFVSGVTGGAGFISNPFLLRYGLTTTGLVATSSACMVLIHLTKIAGYGLGQILTVALLPASLWLASGIIVGNAIGKRLLERMDAALFRKVLLAGLAIASVNLLLGG